MPSYFGKYRAIVVDVKDPEKRGRIRVQCPKVLGDAKSAWCEPCVPVSYDLGGDFALPKVGEFIWVEFEGGNTNYPIYTGGLWSTDKSPSPDYDTKTRLITWGKCKIALAEDSTVISIGGSNITLRDSSAVISVGGSNITLTSGGIKLQSPKIDLN